MFGRRLLRISLAGLVVVGALLAPGAALGQAVLDQSFTSGNGMSAGINKDYAQAQTFTAGRTGSLAGVNVQILSSGGNARLRVSIRNTHYGLPGQTVLATTSLEPQNYLLTQRITFPEQPLIQSGVRYAIVVNSISRRGFFWKGATGDGYTRGRACASMAGGAFHCSQDGNDFHFRTYVYETSGG